MKAVEIYKTKDGQTQIEVKFQEETVWLNQADIVMLFGSSKANISEHIKAVFISGELEPKATVRKFRTVRREGKRQVTREIDHYNLDLIISVGYRVNTKTGIKFRQWATQRLKDHLVKGYTINEKRLQQVSQNMLQLQETIQLIQQSGSSTELSPAEAKGLLDIITNYTQSFILLNRFDANQLTEEKVNENISYEIEYGDAVKAIDELKRQLVKKKEASSLFGKQKDKSFDGILKTVVQTFDNNYLYPSIEEQAAHLLYFIIKNHPFVDGNKRVGAFLFVWFLEKNKHRFKKSGEVKINDNALVALALLVAQSNPTDKELMIKLIMNLINDK